MAKNRLWILCAAVIALMTMWMLAGCGGSSNNDGRMQVFLVDAPLDAEEINVSITSVQVHKAGGGWTTLKEYDPALTVNLLDYRANGEKLLLANSPLEPGHYTMVRLMLSEAEIVIDGSAYDVDLHNVAQTGVKCNGQFTVESGQLSAIILDFIASRSFVTTGHGSFKLIPVMTMSPVDIAAEVTGTLEFQDESENPLPLPDSIVVEVLLPGSSEPLGSTYMEADGTFIFAVLAQGTYDFRIMDGDDVLDTLENVEVTSPSTDLGTIVITVP